MCLYSPSLLDFLPKQVTTERWVEFPVLRGRASPATCSTHSSVYVSPPPIHPTPQPSLVTETKACSLRLCLCFCSAVRFASWCLSNAEIYFYYKTRSLLCRSLSSCVCSSCAHLYSLTVSHA